jgi:hypothetical protein
VVLSWKKLKDGYVLGTNDCEVASIQSRDITDTESLGERHHGCIDCPQWQIVISGNELRNPQPIAGMDRLRDEISGSEIAEEADLRGPTQPSFD